jgi:MYXO-CTERM domain-containing protein
MKKKSVITVLTPAISNPGSGGGGCNTGAGMFGALALAAAALLRTRND